MPIFVKEFKEDIFKYPTYQHQMFKIICKNMNEILPDSKEIKFEQYFENCIKSSVVKTNMTTLESLF